MKKNTRLCALVLVTFVTWSCQSPLDREAEQQKLLTTDREFSDASVKSGAAEAFNRYLTEDALQLPHRQAAIFGRENIYQGMRPNQGHYSLSWEPQAAHVAESGELGYTWGTYRLDVRRAAGGDTTRYGKYLNIWKRQSDGSWKVAIDMGNQSPAPN